MKPPSSPLASSGAASATASRSGGSQPFSSALAKSPSTWPWTRSLLPGWPMPRRTRRKSLVPRQASMLRRPLWPAVPPPSFTRTWPGARSSSSWRTTMSAGSILRKGAASATERPDSFVQVRGLSRRTRSVPSCPSAASPRKRERQAAKRCASAIRSAATKPMLCRWRAWPPPGLPNPTQSCNATPSRGSGALGRLGPGRGRLGLARRRHHRGDREVAVGDGRPHALGQLDLADVQRVADVEAGEGGHELARDRVGRADQLDLAADDVQHAAAAQARAAVLVDEADRHREGQRGALGGTQEVDVQRVVGHRVELRLARQHADGAVAEVEVEHRVEEARVGADRELHLLEREGDRERLLAAAVDDRRHLAGATQRAGGPLAEVVAPLGLEGQGLLGHAQCSSPLRHVPPRAPRTGGRYVGDVAARANRGPRDGRAVGQPVWGGAPSGVVAGLSDDMRRWALARF